MSRDISDHRLRAVLLSALSSSPGDMTDILNPSPEKLEMLKAAAVAGDRETLIALLTELFNRRGQKEED